MAAAVEVYLWRDFSAHKGRTRIWVPDETSGDGLIGPMQEVSNAHLYAARGYKMFTDDGMPGTQATYQDIEDKLQIRFQASDLTFHFYEIPAPTDTIFLDDQITMDPTNDGIIALVAAFVAFAATPGGGAMVTCLGGSRIRRLVKRQPTVVVPAS